MNRKHSDEEIKAMMREVLLENIDKIATAVTSKLKAKLVDRSTFVRNEHRLDFVKKYATLCSEAFTKANNISLSDAKKPAGKAIVELARQELNYKKTTYSGDIYRFVGITYLKSVDKWKY